MQVALLVTLDRPDKLVTLFLSAYEPVKWSITASQGTVIEKVYVSGYYPATLEGLGPGTQIIVLPYGYYIGYTLDSGQFYRTAPKVRELTGMEIASFHGSYQGPHPAPFAIDELQGDPRLHSSYPVPTPLSELPDIRFSIPFQLGSGVFTRGYTLAGPDDGGDLLPGNRRAVADSAGKYYVIADDGLQQIDPASGSVRHIPMDTALPEVSWPMGIAYDSRRDRVLLVTLGGEGFLYGYSPARDTWSLISSMNNVDLASLVYHPVEDVLYGMGVHHPDYGGMTLYRLNPDGSGPRSMPLPLYPWGVHMGSSELVSVGGYLVLLLKPSFFSDSEGESRMYLIDPQGQQAWLTYRSNLPRAADSDGDSVPDHRDRCPNTASGSIVNAGGCSLAQLCPCDGPWRTHAEYVDCVIQHSWEFFRAGLITAEDRRRSIQRAVLAHCGRRPDRTEPVRVHLFPLTREECLRDGLQFVLSGEVWGSCIVECSSDLVNWSVVPNIPAAIDGVEISCPLELGVSSRFYRARMSD